MKAKFLHTIAYLMVLLFFFGILYLAGIIVGASLNPIHWHWVLRMLLAIPAIIGFFRLTIYWIKNVFVK